MLSSVRRTDLALPTGLWSHPLVVQPRFMTDQSNPFHCLTVAVERQIEQRQNGAVDPVLICFHGHLSLSMAIPFLHHCHPLTACILYSSFLRLIASALMPVDCGVERSNDQSGRRDSDRRIPPDGSQERQWTRRQAMVRQTRAACRRRSGIRPTQRKPDPCHDLEDEIESKGCLISDFG